DDGRVRVAFRAVALDFADIFALPGLYSATPQGSFTPGLEFSGVVLECGKDCSQWQPGDRVMGVTRFGGYSTLVDSDPAYLWPLPESWDFAAGAAYPVQTLTAWYALKSLGNQQPGQHVLIHSAAGGVGLQAMQLTRALGGLPVALWEATTRSPCCAQWVLTRCWCAKRILRNNWNGTSNSLTWCSMASAARCRRPASTPSTRWAAWWCLALPNLHQAGNAPITCARCCATCVAPAMT